MQVALYYLDSSAKYILPEIRRLVFRDSEYVRTIVEQLINGPEDMYNHKPSLESSLKLLDYEFVFDGQGNQLLNLKFNKEPVAYVGESADGKKMAMAALAYTLVGFMPNVHGITYQIGETAGDGKVYAAEQYRDLVGSDIVIYLPNSSTSTHLVEVERIIGQDMSNDPRVVLEELMNGPLSSDRSDAYPAMPAGITYDDIRDVYIAKNVMVVDISGDVAQKMADMTQENEFTMIFSIVNTLTSFEGIRSIHFLIDGERADYIGEGWINIIDPIIKNPGIIRY
jgi:spore germination protein GerM